jgi:hypothetical protein
VEVTPRAGVTPLHYSEYSFMCAFYFRQVAVLLLGPMPHSHLPDLGFPECLSAERVKSDHTYSNLVRLSRFRPTHNMDSLTHTAEIPPTPKKFLSSADHPPEV